MENNPMQSRIARGPQLPGRLGRARGGPSRPNPISSRQRLFDLLLDRPAEREQALVDRRRHLADKFDDVSPVFEDPRLPDKLIAEIVDLRLVRWRFALQRLQGKRVAAD